MTIKELEERTGMPRANIRYYEEQKLIFPQRLPNGYRDYSEEDANTLEKIKLLRQLHLDIDTIRLVQQGDLTLEQALFNQLTRLEGDKNAIDRALEVCRKLERSGVEYNALEPKMWLEELKKTALPPSPEAKPSTPFKKAEPPKEPPTEAQMWAWRNPAHDHPWMRYFARAIDVLLVGLVIDILGWLIIPAYAAMEKSTFVEWFLSFCLLVFTLALEPFWLHFWGYTPGKWIFGLKLRDRNGEKLSVSEGYIRAFRVFKEGYGFHIPFYNLYRLWKGRRCCMDWEDCPWDAEEGYLYGREERKLYGLYVVGAYVLSIALAVVMVSETHLPRHREPEGLTLEQFSENYNYVLKVNNLDGYNLMQPDGTFRKESSTSSGGVVINISGLNGIPPKYVVEDGILKEVVLTTVNDPDGGVCRWSLNREQLYLLAFSGAGEDKGLFGYRRDGWLKVWDKAEINAWGDSSFEYRDFKITIECDVSGYTGKGGEYLFPEEGKKQSLTRTVTISWMGEEEQ